MQTDNQIKRLSDSLPNGCNNRRN